jgi:hypothetical protein
LTSGASLDSVRKELLRQPSLLKDLRGSGAWSALGGGESPIFAGAGDSYAASVCASFLAGPPVLAFDPFSLLESLAWAKRRHVYIVSVSGETTSNVELARALKGVAEGTTAITANPESRLAAVVDEVVALPFRSVAKSPGIASFTLSLAAALKACAFDPDCDYERLLSRGLALSKRVRIAGGRSVTYFVGNNESYAASVYGVAKVYELLGARAQASLLEEFSHMPLFSLSRDDVVNVAESPGGRKGKGGSLCRRLKAGGYDSSLVRPKGSRLEGLYSLVFAMQAAAVDAAKARGLNAPYFLGAKKKLKISDEMIY